MVSCGEIVYAKSTRRGILFFLALCISYAIPNRKVIPVERAYYVFPPPYVPLCAIINQSAPEVKAEKDHMYQQLRCLYGGLNPNSWP